MGASPQTPVLAALVLGEDRYGEEREADEK